MYAHLDRWLPEYKTFLELKHTRSGASVWDKARYYMPQLQHYMAVTNTPNCYFSIIPGNDEPRHCVVDRDDAYIENLIKMEQSFWWHVENKEPPEETPFGELARITKTAEAIKVDGYRVADMTKDNLWTDAAARFLANQAAAKAFDQAKDDLRSSIGDDVGEAYGHGIIAKRDVRGRVSIRAAKE
jgi:predicted phage-related endonuclease